MTFVEELGTHLHGRLLEIWEGRSGLPRAVEESYRDLWRLQAGREPKRERCRFLGGDTGERVQCTPCMGKGMDVRFKLFSCSSPDVPRGRCTLELASNDEASCSECAYRETESEAIEKRSVALPLVEAVPSLPPATTDSEAVTSLASVLRTGFADLGAHDDDTVREAHLVLLREAVEDPPPVRTGEGRGIVMGVGGTVYFACAYVAASVLRARGCDLPVEWWHLGRSEIDPTMRRLAESLGVTCVDALEVASRLDRKPRILNGWELKPFAVAHSSFREVLYLDADCVPARDPSSLFDHPQYLRHGAAFWPDLPPYDRAEWTPEVVWRSVGLERRDEVDFESGQFLVNKGRRARELGVTVHLNDYSDWYYRFVYGDKTTFHLAWRVCGSDYAMTPFAAGWVWPAIQQHDFEGGVLFQHVCQGKDQLGRGSLSGLRDEHLARDAARRLREVWHGKIWSAVDSSAGESEVALSLAGRYRYRRLQIHGEPTRDLELRADGTVGEGGADCERYWCVRVLDGVPTLVIVGSAHKGTLVAMMFLTEGADGVWRGRWQAHERAPVELRRSK